MSRPVPDRLVDAIARAPVVDPVELGRRRVATPTVTPAMRAVLELVVDGRTNQQIADELGIGLEAARDRVKRLLRFYAARNRTNLAAIALRRGVVPGYHRRR